MLPIVSVELHTLDVSLVCNDRPSLLYFLPLQRVKVALSCRDDTSLGVTALDTDILGEELMR